MIHMSTYINIKMSHTHGTNFVLPVVPLKKSPQKRRKVRVFSRGLATCNTCLGAFICVTCLTAHIHMYT